jgi:putative oxidoreductase
MRVWVAHAFWMAGLVKIADLAGTQALFESIYHVPLLSPVVAAMLGTWIELVAPWLLGLGIAGRLTALFLLVYNAIAVISYPDLWPHGLGAGLADASAFADHKIWAMMLLAVAAWGSGPLSVDALVGWLRRRWAARRQ